MRARLLGSVLAAVFSVPVAVGALGGSGQTDPPPDSGWDIIQAADPVTLAVPVDSGWDSAPVDAEA